MNKFIKLPSDRKFISVPSNIFGDERLSIGAKGLYVQLYYCNDVIMSLEDLQEYTTSTKEEINQWFMELNECGYLIVKDGICSMQMKAKGEKAVANTLNKEEVKKFSETKKEEQKLTAYQKMIYLIRSYKLDPKITNLLITYFEKWLNKKGRFVDAEDLHGYMVRGKINDLIGFKMSDEDMITCIQTSIDKEWFKFVDHRLSSKASTIKQFDKSTITSGSYTEEDIQRIKERAKQLEAEGKKGTF